MVYQCEITKQWNGEPIDHAPVKMKLEGLENGVKLTIDAPYFNDPAPKGEPGKPLWLLWEYEVVEAFFLNSKTGEYYEVEFGPHGQHLGLLFKKCREVWKKNLEMEYSSKITGNTWTGCSVMPWDYLPAGVDKFNAFAMHGVDANRVYETLYSAPKGKHNEPDFHRLEYFQDFDAKAVFPSGKLDKDEKSIWNTA